MKNTIKKQKGITLLALIITIVVLLILAGVAISSITQFKIVENANATVVLYNEAQVDEKYKLEDYNDWIEKYMNQSGTVVTLFEGNEKTNEDGMIFFGENDLFAEGMLGAKYKIEMESNVYSGTVENILPIYLGTDETGMVVYVLFAIQNGKIIKFTSLKDLDNKLENLTEDSVVVTGVVIEGNSALGFESVLTNEEFIVKKIERTEAKDAKKIFAGNLKLIRDEYVEIPISNKTLDFTRKYLVYLMIDNKPYTVVLNQLIPMGKDDFWIGGMQGEAVKVVLNTKGICYFGDIGTNINLIKMYDVGPVDNYIEEGGFGIYDNGNGEWYLITTPDTTYEVPEKVAGKDVSKVVIDFISGTPIFNKVFEILMWDTPRTFKNVKVTVWNMDFINILIDNAYIENLDLTGCGDRIEIPSYFLEFIEKEDYIEAIYVTPNVKAKYPDNTKIVAK